MMDDIIRLTEQIHKFNRDQLSWEESLKLMDEIVESEEWMGHLEMDMLIYRVGNTRFHRQAQVSKVRTQLFGDRIFQITENTGVQNQKVAVY